MIKLSPLFSQKKNFSTDTRVNSNSSALHNFYAKVTCYRSTVITSIYLYEQQFAHTNEISCWRWFSPKANSENIQSDVTAIIIVSYEKQSIKFGFLLPPVVWFYLLFVCGFFFFSFIPPSIMSSILHPLDHKSSLLICCFFIHKMLFSFVPTSTTLHTMFTMFNQSATIFIHG